MRPVMKRILFHIVRLCLIKPCSSTQTEPNSPGNANDAQQSFIQLTQVVCKYHPLAQWSAARWRAVRILFLYLLVDFF